MKLRPYFAPRNRSHFAGVDLPHAALDLFSPCRFDIFIGLTVNCLQKSTSEFRSIRFREV
jgi:hypothetical protein